MVTQATVLIPQYILAEVTLSFLGLGVGEPVPSWGNMLAEARQYHTLVAHPWMLAPGLATVPLLLVSDSRPTSCWKAGMLALAAQRCRGYSRTS